MKDEQGMVKNMVNEALDIMIPRLAEEYGLELHKPAIKFYDKIFNYLN